MVSRDNHDGALAFRRGNQGVATVLSARQDHQAGTMSGKVEGAGFQVVAKGPTFTANLNLVTRGDKQSVTIKSHDAKADVQGATITLQRG